MKRISIAILFVLFFCEQLFSQAFNNNDNVANLGLGLGGVNLNMGVSASASFEHGTIPIKKVGVISFGAYAGFAHSWQAYSYAGYNETWTHVMLGARAAYHFTIIKVENLDVYAGAIVGVAFGPHTWYDNTIYYLGPVKHSRSEALPIGDVFGGVRYYLKNNMSVFGEVGAGISNLTAGLSFKIL